ncbi:MAG: RecX family transcriptional regulator, partial [Phycisphaerales bacterium]|nr:RecX family transcriptional regulator [Phycisphaerales bacterium]
MGDSLIITAITADPREPDLRYIKVGRQVVARVRRSDVEGLALEVGGQLDPDTLAELACCQRRTMLRLRAIRSISRAAASRQRLVDRLTPHASNMDELESVLDELAAEGLLDDHATATQIAEEILRSGPLGARALSAKLSRRGFESCVVEQIIEDLSAGRDEYADAREAAAIAMRSLRHLPPNTATRRLAARLARRGFSE